MLLLLLFWVVFICFAQWHHVDSISMSYSRIPSVPRVSSTRRVLISVKTSLCNKWKHWSVITNLYITRPKHNITWTFINKLNSNPTKILWRTLCSALQTILIVFSLDSYKHRKDKKKFWLFFFFFFFFLVFWLFF